MNTLEVVFKERDVPNLVIEEKFTDNLPADSNSYRIETAKVVYIIPLSSIHMIIFHKGSAK